MRDIDKLKNWIQDELISGHSEVLMGRIERKDPPTYDFFLKKPLLPLGFSHHYRTGIRVTLEKEGAGVKITRKTLSPPFIFVAVGVTVFLTLFNLFIVRADLNILRIIVGSVTILLTAWYHSVNVSKISQALDEELLLFDKD